MKRWVGLAVLAVVFSSCATVRSWFADRAPSPPAAPPASAMALQSASADAGMAIPPVWLEGPLLRAASAAVGDFIVRSGIERAAARDPLLECLAKPETYDVQVTAELADRWILYLRPRVERCGKEGERLFAATATYEVSRGDYHILGVTITEG